MIRCNDSCNTNQNHFAKITICAYDKAVFLKLSPSVVKLKAQSFHTVRRNFNERKSKCTTYELSKKDGCLSCGDSHGRRQFMTKTLPTVCKQRAFVRRQGRRMDDLFSAWHGGGFRISAVK